jgi:hypothetical protein
MTCRNGTFRLWILLRVAYSWLRRFVNHNHNCSLQITESARFQLTTVTDNNGKGHVNIADTSLNHTAPFTDATPPTIAPASLDDLALLARQCDAHLFANATTSSLTVWSTSAQPEKYA